MLTALDFASRVLADLEQLTSLSAEVQRGNHYAVKPVKKRDGTTRLLHKPDLLLSLTLKKSLEYFQTLNVHVPDHVYGFVRGRSIVHNAQNHLAKPVVLRVDVQRFFESTTRDRIAEALIGEGFTAEAADLCLGIMTVDGVLPIGFHTSPFLSNLAFRQTDAALAELAFAKGVKFTRYVDDLVFSGDFERSLVDEVTQVLSDNEWTVNTRKTAYMKRGGRQYVTGLSVSDPRQPRIPISTKRRLRLKVHLIEKFGYEAYMTTFQGEARGDHPQKLLGMARYVASVERPLGLHLLQSLNQHLSDDWYVASDDYWMDWLSVVE